MNRVVRGFSTIMGLAATLVTFSSGVAQAFPDVVGGLYGDVKPTLTNSGYAVIIAGRVGDKVSDDKCVVSHAQAASELDGFGRPRGKVAVVNLNCYADVASRTSPGYSAGSPEGRTAIDMRKEAEEQKGENASG